GGTCALLVEDSLGVPVYTSTLPADGMEYSYDLSGIGEGMFRLVQDSNIFIVKIVKVLSKAEKG
ncbi:MAG TPA: hypothetical protein IAB87_09245, partial [Candidatus Coprenecus merdipullorum]|nr:hypothetical protein [Candidatus Coprenecus merdipullorum]